MTRRLWITGVVVIAAAAGGASIATATIPDASGVIHGCYSTLPSTSGQLRVIDTDRVRSCGQNEKSLSWNVEGRPGTTGPTGPTGVTGPAGPSGLSQGWFKEGDGACINTCTLVSLSLPPGTFMVTLTGQTVDPGIDGQIRVGCFVTRTDTGAVTGISASAFVTGQAATLASSGVISFNSPASLDVRCNDDVPLGATPDDEAVGLTAVQVDKGNVE